MELSKPKNVIIGLCVLFICGASNGCISQSKDTSPPCDPQPPCLPARSQPLGFSIRLRHADLSAVQLQSAQARAAITAGADSKVFTVEFDQPGKLNWQDQNTFSALLSVGGSAPDTLTIVTREIRVDCCPQLALSALYRNGKKLCENYQPGDVIKL